MKFEIKHRYTGNIVFEAEVGSLKACVELAVKSNANLRNANLRNADLRNADLRNADLRNADLCNADLRNANLCNANLWNADLWNANLRNADLCNANLRNADLCNADLWNANLRNADLKNCCYICAGAGGNSRRSIMCNPKQDLIKAGCFRGTLQEFKDAVVKKYGEDYGSYKGVIAYLDAVIAKEKEQAAEIITTGEGIMYPADTLTREPEPPKPVKLPATGVPMSKQRKIDKEK